MRRHHREGFDLRWYGWLAYSTELALIVEGPYPRRPAAADGAASTVANCGLRSSRNVGIDPGWVPDELGDDLDRTMTVAAPLASR